MDSRTQFEAWFRSKHEGQMITKGKGYSEPITQLMWQAWQASRAAIEVELPAYRDATNHGFSAFNDALDICENELRKHGVSVKG